MLSLDLLLLYWVLFVSIVGLLLMLVIASGDNKGRSSRLVWCYTFLVAVLCFGVYYINSHSSIVLGWFL